MATAVLDVDFDRLPHRISGLHRYRSALVLIRMEGRPVGQALLPIEDGSVLLKQKLLHAADSGFWEAWLARHVGMEQADEPPCDPPPISVAVCTRDRPDDLHRCLQAIGHLPDDGQEVLVIDNCPSTQASRRIVESRPGVRYVCEPRPGLDVARNRALREAAHDIVAFCDDDAAPDANWLRELARNFVDPSVLCVTGLTMPAELETPAQEFFQRSGGLGRGFKRIVYDAARHDPLTAWRAGAGANMAVRKSIVHIVGPFDERLDVGTPVGGGGDTDMFQRILAAGYRIVYAPQALSWHRHRADWSGLLRQMSGYESAGFALLLRGLLVDRELETLAHARDWIKREIPCFMGSLLGRRGSPPLDVAAARLKGALIGPWAFLYSHWLLKRQRRRT